MSTSTSMFDLSGKAALVTGGSKGLGKAMARAFAEHGADVYVCSRHEDELRAAAAEIADGLETRVEWSTADLTDAGQVAALAAEAQGRLGKIDILVNNAGTNIPQPIDEVSDENWAAMSAASRHPGAAGCQSHDSDPSASSLKWATRRSVNFDIFVSSSP